MERSRWWKGERSRAVVRVVSVGWPTAATDWYHSGDTIFNLLLPVRKSVKRPSRTEGTEETEILLGEETTTNTGAQNGKLPGIHLGFVGVGFFF